MAVSGLIAMNAGAQQSPRPQGHAAEDSCPVLTGRYAFWGSWTRFESQGVDERSAVAYQTAHARPRFDQFGLSFVARQIVDPEFVDLHQDRASGMLTVNVIGRAIDARGLDDPVGLPARIASRCVRGEWRVQWQASGGGENLRSDTDRQISLRLSASGEIIATGAERSSTGWLFKRHRSHHWQALFVRLAD